MKDQSIFSHFGKLGTKSIGIAYQDTPSNLEAYEELTTEARLQGMQLAGSARIGALPANIETEAARLGLLGHGFTYSGHPVAAAVAMKTIEIYERRDIVGHVRKVAPLFNRRLSALADHPLVGEAAGVGLIGALELVADKAAKRNFPAEKTVGQICAPTCSNAAATAERCSNRAPSSSRCPPVMAAAIA